MKKWMYNVLIGIFATVFVVSAVLLVSYFVNSQTRKNRYQELSSLRPTVNVRPAPQSGGSAGSSGQTPGQSEPAIPSKTVEVTDPKTGKTRKILVEFGELYKMNSDIVGWLKIPAIGVDYPVMQTPDSPEFYLRRDFDKEKNTGGCLFVQEQCNVFAPSDNITIYGHRMSDGTMFGQLNKFRTKSFRDENPYIYFDTLVQLQTYEVVAVFQTTASEGEGFLYHMFIDAHNQKEFDDFMKACKDLSYYDSGVEVKYGDKLICLSTCDYSRVNGRLVVVAKRVA